MIKIENNQRINVLEIPSITIEQLRESINDCRVLEFFGCRENENIRLYVILADDKEGKLKISSVLFTPDVKSYESLTKDYPSFCNFEREFFEEFGIEPLNHPWLKPLRKNQNKYPFFTMDGDEVHEVAVGPIHAGVIEPGHFRFMCHGEKVYELEIMLGYQHRGVEELLVKSGINNRLAESVCGDSVIGYNIAYSQVMEALSETKITYKAEIIRRIALELERIAVHLGDMGAISGDMAYLQGASIFGVTRTLVINTMLEISGSRFGRGLIDVGGVNFDIDEEMSLKIVNMLNEVENTTDKTTEVIMRTPSCLSRMEKTGVVARENAIKIGAVGMAARSSGVMLDSRFDFKDKWYNSFDKLNFNPTGDVYARFNLRYLEIKQSIKMIKGFLEQLQSSSRNHLKGEGEQLQKYKGESLKVEIGNFIPNSLVVSIVEGWRGEIVHCAITDGNGKLIRYKIKDPSFNNWYMLSLAVRNNGISDFPLCNKSFNLSYCGHDL